MLHYEEAKYETEEMQATVKVQTKHRQVAVTATYCPPKHSLKKYHYIDILSKQGKTFIMRGGYNAKHLYRRSRLTNTKKRTTGSS